MKKIYVFIAMVLGVAVTLNSTAQRTYYQEQQKPEEHTLNMRFGDIIYDQSEDEEYGGYIVSQFFTDTASADLSSEAADDFVVPEGETWTVGSFGVWGTWWPESAGNPEKINIAIYEDDGGKPGVLIDGYSEQTEFYAEEWINTLGELQSYYNFTFPSPLTFTEGHYWISFQVHDSYDKVGQWGWEDKTNTNWETWHWRNPGGGFPGGGTDEWKPSTQVHWFGYALDTRFALYGEAYGDDLAILDITSPVSGELTGSETVTIVIKNQGVNTQTGFDVTYAIDGGAWVVENVGVLELASEESAEYTFTTTADLSETGFFTIAAKTMLAGDEQPLNDEMEIDVVNYGVIHPMVNNDTVDVTTCTGTFTDMGGVNGNILPGNNGVITFYPGEAGKKVKLDFFGVWDISHTTNNEKPFQVFDGPDMNSPVIGKWTQNDWRDFGLKPEILKALGPTGAMTIRYFCPVWDEVEGWTALVSCYEQPEDDFQVTDFFIEPTLIFTNRDITFTATVRNIGSLAQAKDVTFYVNGVAIGSANTGVVQPTEYATVSYVHQFTESGDVALKAAVPEDSGDTPEDNYLTLENFVYENGWFIEMFDDGYFPPEDWTPGNWTGTTSSYQGSGAAMSYAETFTEDTLITPKLVIHNGDILTFYARTSLWWPGNLKVIWKNGETGVWQEIEYLDLGQSPQFKPKQVDVSVAAGENYLGFVNVADIATSWGSEVVVDNVIGIGIEFFLFDNDMKMAGFNPFPTPSKNEPIDYTVKVKNNGHNALTGSDYSVRIMKVMDGGDVEIASAPGVDINSLQFKDIVVNCTFDKIGPAEIYAEIVFAGDEKPENNVSETRSIYVQVNGTTTVQVGEGEDESWEIPSMLGQAWNVSEVIYPADLINQTDISGYITGISYHFNNVNTAPTLDVPVHIYVGETIETNLANGYINGTELTKVAETTCDFPLGTDQQLYIPFTVPYDYQGGNLCVMFFKPGGDIWYPGVNWIGTVTDDDSTSIYTTSYNPPIDPNNLSSLYYTNTAFMPNTTFYVANVGTVPLSGYVYNESAAPFEGVKVEVVGFENETYSAANGYYQLTNLLAWETVIMATHLGYYENEQNIILYQGESNTLNFNMTPLPQVNVSGLVVGNDDPMHYLEGAEVSLVGYENYSALVAADGTFEIPSVYGDKDYELTISYPGYEDYSTTLEVGTDHLDLGTITLNELLMVPFYTQAEQINPGTVQVSWNSPMNGETHLLTWDYIINNGFTAEIGEEVWLGNIYEMDPGTITKVSLYWAKYGETSDTVRLDLVDVNGNVFYSSERFITVQNGWTHIDVPNLTFEGGQFYAMAYWDGLNQQFSDYLAADQYTAGAGINFAYIMYPGAPAYPLSDLLTDYDITFQIDVEIITEAPETGRYNEGYNIFRGPYADINNRESWEKINDEPVFGNEYLDGDWPQPEEGYTYGVQTVYTTGTSEASFSVPIVHDPNFPCDQPWDYTVTGQVHTINIPFSVNPNIFGEPLEVGDWIGVFYLDDEGNEACGGAGQWMPGPLGGNPRAVINAYGNDPTTPEKDGFAAGETFRWKMFDCSGWDEYPAGATYDETQPNQGQFADFGLSKVTSLQVMFCQYYSFNSGWNSLSAYITPFDAGVENMFAPVVDQLTIMRNLTEVYWPAENINTIGTFDNTSGYVLKTTEAVNFEICGADFANGEITFESAGWYYLPVLSECGVDAMELFTDHLADIVIVQDLIGTQVFWPAMNVYTLQTLMPGKAYKMKISNPFTLMFPACDSRGAQQTFSRQNHLNTPWGEINMTPATQLVSFSAGAAGQFFEGDLIGAFDRNGNLSGFMEVYSISQNQVMTLFGDDATSSVKEGFEEGEQISFRLLRIQTGEEFVLDVEWDFTLENASGNFYNNSLSAVKAVNLEVTGIGGTSAGNIDIYPNPATDLVVVTLPQGISQAELMILDAKGNTVAETRLNNTKTTLNTASLQPGIYVVKIQGISLNKITKLIIR